MRLACEATFDVYKLVFAAIREGMSQEDIAHLVEAGFSKMGLRGGALVLLGASAALPHGTKQPQKLKEGDVILIDGGCAVDGYASDVTRMGILGKPSEKIAKAYELTRKAQDAALDAARAGRLSGTVDDAARAVITAGGYGPDYKFFTHRLGHGIGLDGHEHPYLVRGSKTNLEPGMTFSNEPGIYVVGEFGIRCEDDMVIMPDGRTALDAKLPGFARKAAGLILRAANRFAKLDDPLLHPESLGAASVRYKAAMSAVLGRDKLYRRVLRWICAQK
jgi:Xaa-Pro dipeptidase